MEADGRSSLLGRIVRRVGQIVPAYFVLALGLLISFAAWRFTEQRVGREAESNFQHEVAQAAGALDRRFQDNVNLLIGLRGLFEASDRVDRDDFKLLPVELQPRADATPASGWCRSCATCRSRTSRRSRESVRRDRSVNPRGYPAFGIKPPGVRDEYMVVTYIEPFSGNERAFGFDVFSEPPRRPSVERTRDSGQATASEPIWLAADPQKQISLALRMPVYRRGMPVSTVAQRRAAFLGVVSSAIHVDDLVGGLLGRQLGSGFDLVIHDLGFSGAGRPARRACRRKPGVRQRPDVQQDGGAGRRTHRPEPDDDPRCGGSHLAAGIHRPRRAGPRFRRTAAGCDSAGRDRDQPAAVLDRLGAARLARAGAQARRAVDCRARRRRSAGAAFLYPAIDRGGAAADLFQGRQGTALSRGQQGMGKVLRHPARAVHRQVRVRALSTRSGVGEEASRQGRGAVQPPG